MSHHIRNLLCGPTVTGIWCPPSTFLLSLMTHLEGNEKISYLGQILGTSPSSLGVGARGLMARPSGHRNGPCMEHWRFPSQPPACALIRALRPQKEGRLQVPEQASPRTEGGSL